MPDVGKRLVVLRRFAPNLLYYNRTGPCTKNAQPSSLTKYKVLIFIPLNLGTRFGSPGQSYGNTGSYLVIDCPKTSR